MILRESFEGQRESEKTGGNMLAKAVAEYIEEISQEHGGLFKRIETTDYFDQNDLHHVDIFADVGGGLPCAIDIAGINKQKGDYGDRRLRMKYKNRNFIPFICRVDKDGKPISEPMPHFVVGGLDTAKWVDWIQEADRDGVPVNDVMPESENEGQYQIILTKVLDQILYLERSGTNSQRQKIEPYKTRIYQELLKILPPDKKEKLESIL